MRNYSVILTITVTKEWNPGHNYRTDLFTFPVSTIVNIFVKVSACRVNTRSQTDKVKPQIWIVTVVN